MMKCYASMCRWMDANGGARGETDARSPGMCSSKWTWFSQEWPIHC
uniref:Uncharacterized protein n=1 Tax=Arundo donax TaxID=35708 RepID=A0A0A9CCQ7_ARUDO